ncbi:phosphate propanoyltransferase [Niallia sp. JL1B1071]|uniref:Phosphate propanoyltransferase n=1 Tax=Niallia hominis TaxID=3133173 RepID=A0ABV1EY84_9BACI
MKEEISQQQLAQVVEELLNRISEPNKETEYLIPVGVSNRHIHLCQEDIHQLFGREYKLNLLKELKQPGQYAAKETVTIVGTKGVIENVRVLGPARGKSQVEISKTDAFKLGVKAPVNESGDLTNAASVCVVGPKGIVHLHQNVIIAKRHLHMSPADAVKFSVADKQKVAIKACGDRETIYLNTVVRVREDFVLECHLDMDEANAAGLSNHSFVEIIEAG